MTERDGSSGSSGPAAPADSSGSAAEGGDVVPLRPPKPCPTCGKPSTRKAYPFCSARCADVDLGRWFTEAYSVPAEDEDEFSETPPEAANDDG